MEKVKKIIGMEETESQSKEKGVDSKKLQDLERNRIDDGAQGSFMTTNFGTRVDNTDNTLKVGERGPALIEDFNFREKLTHFDHERIPERVVHARGAGAHGYFQVYESLEDITMADFLCNPSKKTPVFVRFSTVLGFRGSADTVRDVHGFATKFYTDEGNFDLVGNNLPVFFIQDGIKFPDLIHAGKPEPHNEMPQGATAHDNFWDFISLTPEAMHIIMWALSDRAIPRSFRMMQGFGIHSFIMVNREGKRKFVKFHWLPTLGIHSLVWDEAQKLCGVDPDFLRRDLWEAIESGSYPEFELGLQIVDEADEHKFDFDLLDSTKIIPEELVPIRRVGKLVLNRNPDNFFAETEQVAFHPSRLVPGIEISDDPLLQTRSFSYTDTQLNRLGGPNFEELPINRPVVPVTNSQRDGIHRHIINQDKKNHVNYFPNRFGCPAIASLSQGAYVHQPVLVNGQKVRVRGPKFNEHYKQARLFYNSMSYWERKHIINAARFELGKVSDMNVRKRMVEHLSRVDADLGRQVALGIGVKFDENLMQKALTHTEISKALSFENTVKDSIRSRRIALLIAPGHNSKQVSWISAGLSLAGAIPMVVSLTKGPIPGDTGESNAEFTFLTAKSVMFDGLVLIGGQRSVEMLDNEGEIHNFVLEAFKHCKPIAALEEAVAFLERLQLPGIDFARHDGKVVSDQGVVTLCNGFSEDSMKMNQLGFGKSLFDAIAVHRHHQREVSKVPA